MLSCWMLQVWAPALDSYMPIKRVGHGGVTSLRWSPKGSKLFTACPSAMFRSALNRYDLIFAKVCNNTCYKKSITHSLSAYADNLYCNGKIQTLVDLVLVCTTAVQFREKLTTAKEVMFLPVTVYMFVCTSMNGITQKVFKWFWWNRAEVFQSRPLSRNHIFRWYPA